MLAKRRASRPSVCLLNHKRRVCVLLTATALGTALLPVDRAPTFPWYLSPSTLALLLHLILLVHSWESKELGALGNALSHIAASEAVGIIASQTLKHTFFGTLMSAVALPAYLMKVQRAVYLASIPPSLHCSRCVRCLHSYTCVTF